MIISEGRRYIFVHIPKTGGTSLALALEQRAMRDDILIGDTPKAKRRRKRLEGLPAKGRLWKHAGLQDIEGIIEMKDLARFFVFTMVRNPWDRMVSYYHWLRTQKFDHPAVSLAQALSFGDFLRDATTQNSLRSFPSVSYVSDDRDQNRCRLFIRLEHFEQDVKPLEQHLGFDIELPHVNASDRQQDYRDYYTSDLVDIIADCCSDDIERFGYSFGKKA